MDAKGEAIVYLGFIISAMMILSLYMSMILNWEIFIHLALF
jgi:hypothetical protein